MKKFLNCFIFWFRIKANNFYIILSHIEIIVAHSMPIPVRGAYSFNHFGTPIQPSFNLLTNSKRIPLKSHGRRPRI